MKKIIVLLTFALISNLVFSQSRKELRETMLKSYGEKANYLKEFESNLHLKEPAKNNLNFHNILLMKDVVYKFFVIKTDNGESDVNVRLIKGQKYSELIDDQITIVEIEKSNEVYSFDFKCQNTQPYSLITSLHSGDEANVLIHLAYVPARNLVEAELDKTFEIIEISKNDADEYMKETEDEIFLVVEEMPKFQGSNDKDLVHDYIRKNLKIPQSVKNKCRVFVQFVVNKDGYIKDVKFVKSPEDAAIRQEVMRVIYSMPRWEPGKQRGHNVSVMYTFPVVLEPPK